MSYIGTEPVTKASRVIIEGSFNQPSRYIPVPGGYSPGNLLVYINGVRLLNDDFVATDGDQVDLIDTFPSETVYAVEEVRNFLVADTYTKAEADSRFSTASGASGGGNDQIFYENGQSINFDYTIPSSKNAMTTGPITISDGVTVTVSDGARWVII